MPNFNLSLSGNKTSPLELAVTTLLASTVPSVVWSVFALVTASSAILAVVIDPSATSATAIAPSVI